MVISPFPTTFAWLKHPGRLSLAGLDKFRSRRLLLLILLKRRLEKKKKKKKTKKNKVRNCEAIETLALEHLLLVYLPNQPFHQIQILELRVDY